MSKQSKKMRECVSRGEELREDVQALFDRISDFECDCVRLALEMIEAENAHADFADVSDLSEALEEIREAAIEFEEEFSDYREECTRCHEPILVFSTDILAKRLNTLGIEVAL